MRVRFGPGKWNAAAAALLTAAVLGLHTGSAAAQSEILDELLEKLKDKGVLSEDEYQALKKAREEERVEQRAERRRQALKAASDAEKEEKAKQATKVDINPGIKSIQVYGDLRLRYESRAGSSSFPIQSAGNAFDLTSDRWRYAGRIGLRGDLTDDWFYGLRLDTGTNPRSSWVTFGNNNNAAAGGSAPFGKGGDGIQFGQAYLGWRAWPWLTVQAGKMPNPFFTTPMVWDPDINPEGLSERINYAFNDNLTLFANFGQFVYQQYSPNDNSGGLGFASHDGYMFGWQGGASYKFAEKVNARAAVSFYNYAGMNRRTAFNTIPNGFQGPFAAGAQNTLPANNLGFHNGTNDLRYFEVPFEVNFPVGPWSGRAFGDVAYNLKAGERAAHGSYASAGDEGLAYQLGFAVGTNLGLTMNQVAAKKNTWEARVYYQRVQLNSIDPNLTDSDYFEGRTNLEGVFMALAYAPTDSIIGTLRFGGAHRLNANAPTPGSNPDIPAVQPLTQYKLIQFDLTWKF
jgi:hypothetical protein